MYAIRTYNHAEVFFTISARKLEGKVLKLFKEYWRKLLLPIEAFILLLTLAKPLFALK